MTGPPLIEVEDLRIDLNDGSSQVAAVEGVSFRIDRGETFGLVGGVTLATSILQVPSNGPAARTCTGTAATSAASRMAFTAAPPLVDSTL